MDATPISQLGQQLRDFLVNQFAPPPGMKGVLGFLGSGVAVDPDSFRSQAQFNPARINAWLNIVVDPLGSVNTDIDRVESVPMTASELMFAICCGAVSVDPAGSPAQGLFNKIKSRAMENLGGTSTVSCAPLDWYDPGQVPQWAKCSLTTESSSSTSSATNSGPPSVEVDLPPRPSLWAWRQLHPRSLNIESMRDTETLRYERLERSPTIRSMPRQRFLMSSASLGVRASAESADVAPVGAARLRLVDTMEEARVISISPAPPATTAEPIIPMEQAPLSDLPVPIQRAPFAAMTENVITSSDAIMVSQAISTAANEASSSHVDSSSFSLNLNYLVVQLSRAPWWDDVLLLMDNWYIPGQQRAAFLSGSTLQSVVGVPMALILTANVEIRANWSETDRDAATNNTHLGPWALNSAHFTATSNVGEAVLTIPGIQAIACIYRALPPVPPASDPALAKSAPT